MFIILFIYLFIFIRKIVLPAPRNQARMEPMPSTVEAQSPNHWATGKSLVFIILSHYVLREIVIWQQIIDARTQVSDGGIIWRVRILGKGNKYHIEGPRNKRKDPCGVE